VSANELGAQRLPEPLVRHIVLGGLKSWDAPPVRIPLAPMTLIFGQNSAGKSSMISALTLLRQTIMSERPFELTSRGELVDVGSFRLAVHDHDLDSAITLGLGFTSPNPKANTLLSADTLRELSFAYTWDSEDEWAGRTRFNVDLGGYATSFELDSEGHYLPEDEDAQWRNFLESLAVAREVMPPLSPLGGRSIITRSDYDDPAGGLSEADPLAAIRLGLSVQLSNELSEVLSRIAYLGPIRARPDRTDSLTTSGYKYVGPEGEHTTDVLYSDPALLAEVNEWFDKLGLGYRIKIVTPVSEEVKMTAGDFAVLGLIDTRDETPNLVSPRAVGYGISQITPIVVQSLMSERGVVIIEQPEVHIHPRLQASVGDLLIHSVKERGNQMIVETHSEHLVLRLLRRIREGVIAPEDVSILYVDVDSHGCAYVRRLDVDSDGDLIEGWPGGFFDERLEEVLGTRW